MECNLPKCLINNCFSKKINKTVTKKELFKHLHYLKDQKNAIPYVTSYYKDNWGFCISENQKDIVAHIESSYEDAIEKVKDLRDYHFEVLKG